jgi:hypothetical protein
MTRFRTNSAFQLRCAKEERSPGPASSDKKLVCCTLLDQIVRHFVRTASPSEADDLFMIIVRFD